MRGCLALCTTHYIPTISLAPTHCTCCFFNWQRFLEVDLCWPLQARLALPVLSPPTSRRHPAYCAFSPAQLSVRRRPHRTNWLDAAYAKQSHLKNVLNLSSDRVCITPRTPLSCLNFTTQCSSCTLARVLHMHISFFLKLVAFLRARSSFWNSSNQVQVAIKCWAVVSYVNT